MKSIRRRSFVAGTAGALATYPGLVKAAQPKSNQPSKIKVALIGCGGRAGTHRDEFQKLAQIVWVCDPDKKRLAEFEKATGAKGTTDMRRVLDDKEVQAVVVSTPDHWHAPASILACNAGKHVYVEKPCSHNFIEGDLLVKAARKNNVIVQHGTQSRSTRKMVDAIQLLKEGVIGDVLMAKAWNIQRRSNIGKSSPSAAPEHVDYDAWIGPAEFMPYQSNRFHYSWHWWHNFGTGDIGNDGAHEIDIARWGLGVTGFPSTASALGGKYYFDDDQQFPDHATCNFEWPGDGQVGHRRQLMFEMRIWSTNYPYNCDSGVEFYGTKGQLMVSKRGKFMLWSESNKSIDFPTPNEVIELPSSHQADFLDAIAKGTKPSADIQIGHESTALIHLANIAVRTGKQLDFDPKTQTITNDAKANQMLGRTYRSQGHWSVPSV
jgi:predicted dehydrogenase